MSRKKTIIIVAGVALAAGAAATLAAQGPRGRDHGGMGYGMMGHGMMGGGYGYDGDRGERGRGMRERMGGRPFGSGLTAEEYDTRTRERFARLDKNSDGVIDSTEIAAHFATEGDGRRGKRGGRHGGERGGMGGRMERMFDTNRDGKVTADEARAEAERHFAQMDLNSDGKIDDADLPPNMRGRDALKSGMGQGRGGGMFGRFRAADANGDGVVTKEEYLAQSMTRFTAIDTTKDGTVDQADRDAMQKAMSDYRVQRFLHMFGATKDGKVTKEQFDKVAKERFARLDVNADGKLTREDGGRRGHGMHGGRHGMGEGHGMRQGQGQGQGMGPGMGPGTGGQGGEKK